MPLNARQLQHIWAEEHALIADGHAHDPRDRYPAHRRDPFDEVAAFQSSPVTYTPAAGGGQAPPSLPGGAREPEGTVGVRYASGRPLTSSKGEAA